MQHRAHVVAGLDLALMAFRLIDPAIVASVIRVDGSHVAAGEAIAWPPGRNEPCWCGSGRKYKKCCADAPARPMHDPKP